MSCFGGVDVTNTTPVRKSGYLQVYKRGCFSSGFKTCFVVLHQDSMIIWYSEQGKSKAIDRVTVKNVCNFMAVGPYTRGIPNRPDLPHRNSEQFLIALPNLPSRSADKIHYFICSDQNDFNSWMTEICKTLPPPTQQPTRPSGPPAPQGGQAGAPPPYPASNAAYPPQPAAYPQKPAYPQQRAPYPQHHPQQAGGGHTTVVVQDRGRGDDGFATGMLMGAVMMGGPRWGWGFGGGWGYGGWGHYDFGPDIHVHNEYNIDNTNIENNEYNETNIENTENNFGGDTNFGGDGGFDHGGYGTYDYGADQGGDVGGYGGGDFGGGDYGGGDFGGGDFGGGDFGGGDFGDMGGGDFGGDAGGCGGGCGGD